MKKHVVCILSKANLFFGGVEKNVEPSNGAKVSLHDADSVERRSANEYASIHFKLRIIKLGCLARSTTACRQAASMKYLHP